MASDAAAEQRSTFSDAFNESAPSPFATLPTGGNATLLAVMKASSILRCATQRESLREYQEEDLFKRSAKRSALRKMSAKILKDTDKSVESSISLSKDEKLIQALKREKTSTTALRAKITLLENQLRQKTELAVMLQTSIDEGYKTTLIRRKSSVNLKDVENENSNDFLIIGLANQLQIISELKEEIETVREALNTVPLICGDVIQRCQDFIKNMSAAKVSKFSNPTPTPTPAPTSVVVMKSNISTQTHLSKTQEKSVLTEPTPTRDQSWQADLLQSGEVRIQKVVEKVPQYIEKPAVITEEVDTQTESVEEPEEVEPQKIEIPKPIIIRPREVPKTDVAVQTLAVKEKIVEVIKIVQQQVAPKKPSITAPPKPATISERSPQPPVQKPSPPPEPQRKKNRQTEPIKKKNKPNYKSVFKVYCFACGGGPFRGLGACPNEDCRNPLYYGTQAAAATKTSLIKAEVKREWTARIEQVAAWQMSDNLLSSSRHFETCEFSGELPSVVSEVEAPLPKLFYQKKEPSVPYHFTLSRHVMQTKKTEQHWTAGLVLPSGVSESKLNLCNEHLVEGNATGRCKNYFSPSRKSSPNNRINRQSIPQERYTTCGERNFIDHVCTLFTPRPKEKPPEVANVRSSPLPLLM